ncbi:e3 ubiquitin-protein ligase march 2/3 family member [Holotrichia oblita]|uniref:E3 ubiquitin-protein ligase march 2/3 family member n=1 Tax=Holotrichia oblita TaxID=644536 RepID=A0ACB9T301_HOLOL|nr:e3 ubiquitin-protein ligase march 2/3 family member [Holotrichia oblita]
MSSASIDEAQLHSNYIDNCIEQKDIVVSIILSESTASLLGVDAPNLQDILSEESSTSIFSLKNFSFFKDDLSSTRASGQSLKHLFMKNRYRDADYINVDEVYFSRTFSTTSSSLSSLNSLREADSEAVVPEENMVALPIMEKYKVYTRPLLSAKTTAHEDRLKCKSNNIYVSILESELTITSSGWVNFCRICHGGESVANLITPCRCRGSIALAHLQCLEEWLKQSANSRCELCQHRYEIIREPKYVTLISLQQITVITIRNNVRIGMATIDFTYSSWLVVMFQRHIDAWKEWYQNSCTLRLLLPPRKLRRHNRRTLKETTANQVD